MAAKTKKRPIIIYFWLQIGNLVSILMFGQSGNKLNPQDIFFSKNVIINTHFGIQDGIRNSKMAIIAYFIKTRAAIVMYNV